MWNFLSWWSYVLLYNQPTNSIASRRLNTAFIRALQQSILSQIKPALTHICWRFILTLSSHLFVSLLRDLFFFKVYLLTFCNHSFLVEENKKEKIKYNRNIKSKLKKRKRKLTWRDHGTVGGSIWFRQISAILLSRAVRDNAGSGKTDCR